MLPLLVLRASGVLETGSVGRLNAQTGFDHSQFSILSEI
jgi:hypothetical protein